MPVKHVGIASQGGYSERGVVLHCMKFSERQMIIHMLTQSHGRISYMTNMGGKKFGSSTRSLFQPLFIVEFQGNRTTGTMHRMSQCEPSPMLINLPLDIYKSAIAMFVSELLYRLVREPLDDKNIYHFVESSIIELNDMEESVANFHLWFLVHFAYFMGYGFPTSHHQGDWMDIKTGEYTQFRPMHPLRMAPEYVAVLHRLSTLTLSESHTVALSRTDRVNLLHALVDYYSYHTETFNTVKSIGILSELF